MACCFDALWFASWNGPRVGVRHPKKKAFKGSKAAKLASRRSR